MAKNHVEVAVPPTVGTGPGVGRTGPGEGLPSGSSKEPVSRGDGFPEDRAFSTFPCPSQCRPRRRIDSPACERIFVGHWRRRGGGSGHIQRNCIPPLGVAVHLPAHAPMRTDARICVPWRATAAGSRICVAPPRTGQNNAHRLTVGPSDVALVAGLAMGWG